MTTTYRAIIMVLLLLTLSTRCFSNDLIIESPAFHANTLIPSQYTCSGSDHSPPLSWRDTTKNTKSYALILEDPDAPSGVWIHWVVFNIPKTIQSILENTALPTGAVSGQNSWGKGGYRGPCPPAGTHRYVFKLYALDTLLGLSPSATANDLITAMKNHINAETQLVALYSKQ